MINSQLTETQRSAATNWGYTELQLECYRAMLVDFQKYVAGLNHDVRAAVEPRITFIASMTQFCLSVQYLFYQYLREEDQQAQGDKPGRLSDYHSDKAMYGWKYNITEKEFDASFSPTFRIAIETKYAGKFDDVITEMLHILNNWAQQYGCFRTYNDKLQYKDFWDKIDAENA